MLGTILFNFGFVTTVPSWVNEKEPGTRVNPVMWSSTTLCVFIFCVMGIPPAIAFAPYLEGPVTGTCLQAQTDPSFNCANDVRARLANACTRARRQHLSLCPIAHTPTLPDTLPYAGPSTAQLMQIPTQPQTAPWQSSRAASVLLSTSVYLFPIAAVVS